MKPQERRIKIVELYDEGCSTELISTLLKTSPRTVLRALQEAYGKDYAHIRIIRDYKDGISKEEIARRNDCSVRTINDHLRKENLTKTNFEKADVTKPRYDVYRVYDNEKEIEVVMICEQDTKLEYSQKMLITAASRLVRSIEEAIKISQKRMIEVVFYTK